MALAILQDLSPIPGYTQIVLPNIQFVCFQPQGAGYRRLRMLPLNAVLTRGSYSQRSISSQHFQGNIKTESQLQEHVTIYFSSPGHPTVSFLHSV